MPDVRVERHGAVTVVTLDRVQRRNALGRQLRRELEEAAAEFDADPDQRVAILAANGPIFCAGADLKELSESAKGTDHLAGVSTTTVAGVGDCVKPWLAALDAPALAGGLELVLNCDIRIAAEDVWFTLPEVGLGMIPGIAVHQLVRQVPYGDAMWLLLTGERIDVTTARRIGLVQEVVQRDALGRAMELAQKMATFSAGAMIGTKAIARHWRDHELEASIRFYLEVNATDTRSDEMIGRVSNFFAGRKPAGGEPS